MMFGRWFKGFLIYNSASLGFFYSLYEYLFKLKAISETFASFRSISTSILKPKYLIHLINLLCILSVVHLHCVKRTFRDLCTVRYYFYQVSLPKRTRYDFLQTCMFLLLYSYQKLRQKTMSIFFSIGFD